MYKTRLGNITVDSWKKSGNKPQWDVWEKTLWKMEETTLTIPTSAGFLAKCSQHHQQDSSLRKKSVVTRDRSDFSPTFPHISSKSSSFNDDFISWQKISPWIPPGGEMTMMVWWWKHKGQLGLKNTTKTKNTCELRTKKPSYFPWNIGWLKTGSFFLAYEINPHIIP